MLAGRASPLETLLGSCPGGWARPTAPSSTFLVAPAGCPVVSQGCMCGERWGQDGGRQAGSSLPVVLDGAQISAPPVPPWAHLELDQRRNSTAGGAEPGLTPNKPAPHCPALPSENHSQGPLPAPAHHALRLRAWGSLTPPEAPVSRLQLQLSLPSAPLPPSPHQERWALDARWGLTVPGGPGWPLCPAGLLAAAQSRSSTSAAVDAASVQTGGP